MGLRVLARHRPQPRLRPAPLVPARRSRPRRGRRARARFIFRDGRGPTAAGRPTTGAAIFGGRAWTRVTEADGRPGQWYLHLFAAEQPDLDWTNPEVRSTSSRRCGSGSTAASTGSGSTSPTAWSRPRAAGHRRDGRPPPTAERVDHPALGPRRRARDLPRLARPRRRLRAAARVRRRGVGPQPAAAGACYVRPDELHTAFNFEFLLAPWDADALREVDRRRARRPRGGRRAADLGPVQPRHRARGVALRASAGRRARAPAQGPRRPPGRLRSGPPASPRGGTADAGPSRRRVRLPG